VRRPTHARAEHDGADRGKHKSRQPEPDGEADREPRLALGDGEREGQALQAALDELEEERQVLHGALGERLDAIESLTRVAGGEVRPSTLL
jgi:hypothetical protein